MIKCPCRKNETVILDFWTTEDKCSYCGSIREDIFFDYITKKFPVTISKETKSFYFDNNSKFCYHHLSEENKVILTQLFKEGKILIKNKG